MKYIIIPIEFPVNKGGLQQSVSSLINGLSVIENFKIIVVSPNESEISKCTFPKGVLSITSKAKDWKISKKHFFSTFCVALDLYGKLKRYINKDTLFITNHSGSSYIVSLLPVWRVNELYINRGGDFKTKGFGDFFMKKKIKNRRINYAVATSNRQRNLLIEIGMPQNRVFVIHNGLKLPTSNYNYKPIDSNSFWISTMGYLSSTKNQHIGVQLIKMLRDKGLDAKLNLYGVPNAEVEYNKMLDKTVEDLGVKEYVYYRGFVKGEDLFSQTDILISFSSSEGFGRSLVEGMLRKIPVIAYRGAGGPIDITNDGKYCYLVDKNDASHYYDVVQSIIKNPEETKANVLSSYNYAMNMFTEDVMVKKYTKLLDDIFKETL